MDIRDVADNLAGHHIKLVSNPYKRRVGLVPMVLALTVCWLFALAWFGAAIWLVTSNLIWALVLGSCTAFYMAFLSLMSYKTAADGFRDYVLEVTDDEAVLIVVDRLRKKKLTQMVLLRDVKYGEYYPYSDSAAVILHAPYVDMEIPLWPMSRQGRDVIDFLEGKGVPIVNVQSDDKFPD